MRPIPRPVKTEYQMAKRRMGYVDTVCSITRIAVMGFTIGTISLSERTHRSRRNLTDVRTLNVRNTTVSHMQFAVLGHYISYIQTPVWKHLRGT